jgi:hypothetical protein
MTLHSDLIRVNQFRKFLVNRGLFIHFPKRTLADSVCHLLLLSVIPFVLTGCIECLGSPFSLGYDANGQLTFDDATVNAPTTIRMSASREFEPTCGNRIVVKKVAFYWGSNLLAVDTAEPFEFVWNAQPGKDGVPLSGVAVNILYAVANDQYTSQRPKLTIQVTAALRQGN